MSNEPWNKAGLGPGVVAGISVGAAIIFIIPVVIIAIYLLRARRRRKNEDAQQRWSIYPGGNVSANDRRYVSASESGKSSYRNAFILQRPYGRRLPLPAWHDPAPHHQAPLGSSKESLISPHTSVIASNDTTARLSWPLRSQASPQALFSTWHINMVRLSPIAESPLPRSQSSPVLTSPLLGSPRMPRAAFLSFKRPLQTLASGGIPNWRSNTDLLDPQSDKKSPNKLRKRPRAERSLSSRFARSLSSHFLANSGSEGSKLSVDSNKARPESCTIPLAQSPPIRPQEMSPVPMQQLVHSGSILRVVNATEKETRDFNSGSSDGKLPAGLIEHASQGFIIEDPSGDSKLPTQDVTKDDPQILKTTPRSSSSSDELEMYNGQAIDWETPPVAGLRSPSRRHKRRQSKVTPTTASSKKKHQTPDTGNGLIRDDSRVSLGTLGGNRREPQAEKRSDPTQSPTADEILLTPSSNPMTVRTNAGTTPIGVDPITGTKSLGRVGTTVLRDITGNGGDSPTLKPFYSQPLFPMKSTGDMRPWNARGSSLTSPPISAIKGKGRKQGHKRQNCVRISTQLPVTLHSARSSFVFDEPTKLQTIPQTPPSSGVSSRDSKIRPLPRPPSSATFDPQLSPLNGKGNNKENWNNDKSDQDLSRSKSTLERPKSDTIPGFKPNRFSTGSSIFSEPLTGFSRPNSIASEAPQNSTIAICTNLDAAKQPSPIEEASSPFDISPLRIPLRSPNRPSNFIRGPRTPPSRRRSPHRTPPSQDLFRSVVALRRMNSDISIARSNSGASTNGREQPGRSKSTSYYLNLGQPRGAQSERALGMARRLGEDADGHTRSSISIPGADDNGSPVIKRVKFDMSPRLEARMKKGVGVGFRDLPQEPEASKLAVPDPPKRGRIVTGLNGSPGKVGAVGLGLSFKAGAATGKGSEFYDQAGFLIS
ncbi:MAG: hypothetical protein M4579_002195 [Chaenotheca gracillima]|nr:MAG: hypothetical protein M4579_002195 [Chaenotheca gracillima]